MGASVRSITGRRLSRNHRSLISCALIGWLACACLNGMPGATAGHQHQLVRNKAAPRITVESFGAKGDGRTDDSDAISRAFRAACSGRAWTTLVLGAGKTYLSKHPLSFTGPCRSQPLYIQLDGTLQFDTHATINSLMKVHALLHVSKMKLLRLGGRGTIHGKGADFWGGRFRPHLVQVSQCDEIKVHGITTVDAPRMHINFQYCQGVTAQGIKTLAPANSPNTDSIHVGSCQGVLLEKMRLHSGDDCVSIVGNTKDLVARNITCTAGHGYSIGSLGYGGDTVCIDNITISDSNLQDTTNGLRIKSYEGGQGLVRNVEFRNIRLNNVRHPIILNQFYCDKKPCSAGDNTVALFDIRFKSIVGTTTDPIRDGGVILDCSPSSPCSNLVFDHINVWSSKGPIKLQPRTSSAYGKNIMLRSPQGLRLKSAEPSRTEENAIRSQAAKCGVKSLSFAS